MTAPTAPPEGFNANARCLAFHGPLLYESKILKVRIPGVKSDDIALEDIPAELHDQITYLIHYKGWKSSWDEWLPQERVLRWNEENLRLQKELKNEALQALRKKKSGEADDKGSSHGSSVLTSTAGGSGTGATTSAQKRKEAAREHSESTRGLKKSRRDAEEKDGDYFSNLDVSINVPDVLKAQLVDDWEYVTKNSQLTDLPRKPSVTEILSEFKSACIKRRPSNAEVEILEEVIEGIQLYFNKSLGSILLYRFERQQYLEVSRAYPDRLPSSIYGAEHLLRLFVSLPGLLSHTHMDQQSLNVLKTHLEDLLRFLANNQKQFFMESYINSTPVYEAISRGL
ncbi:MRG-domain-containing protein [Lipomyces oligophaga]|uniref:MRG-domain-containing protein n=1 Tax=Lipomyces oligophaga TaxID=45792 RepID=UPI0034CF5A09